MFAHRKIIDAVRRVLDSDAVWFTGHSDLHLDIESGWHKDSGSSELGDPVGGYLGKGCLLRPLEVVKVGVYITGTDSADCMWVDEGSHRRPGLKAEDPRPVEVDPGDAVLFDVRLTHRGPEDLASAKRSRPRVAAFASFGLIGPGTRRFAERNMDRQLRQVGGRSSNLPLPEDVRHAFEDQGVKPYQRASAR